MSADERLRRSYQRLLYVYPGWYRRERREEMVTTLLEAAAPGQHRPALRDTADLVVSGLRCRLRLPSGIISRLVAVLLAGITGLAGAVGAVHLTSYPGPPGEAQALTAAAAALPERPADHPGPPVSCDYWCPEWAGGDEVIAYDGPLDRTDHVLVVYDPPAEQVPDRVAEAHARLAAAGWTVYPVAVQGDGVRYFTATGTGLRLTVTGHSATGESSYSAAGESSRSLDLVVTKGFSRPAAVADLLGFAGGALIGWLTVAWVLQRRRRQHPAVRAAIVLAGMPALLFAAAAWYGTTNVLVATLFGDGLTDPNAVLLPGLPFIIFPPATLVAGIAASTVLVLSALPAAPTAVGTEARPGAA